MYRQVTVADKTTSYIQMFWSLYPKFEIEISGVNMLREKCKILFF